MGWFECLRGKRQCLVEKGEDSTELIDTCDYKATVEKAIIESNSWFLSLEEDIKIC